MRYVDKNGRRCVSSGSPLLAVDVMLERAIPASAEVLLDLFKGTAVCFGT